METLSTTPYISPSRRADCTGCGRQIQTGRGSLSVPYCLDCRRAGLAPKRSPHGSTRRYKSGCRCDECRSANSRSMREYAARRRARGEPLSRGKLVETTCAYCSRAFEARPAQRYCSLVCARDVQGRSPEPRFKISQRVRFEIYERDGWLCQICGEEVPRNVDPWSAEAATLDHIVPRSRGGSDDPSNLRLASRSCNSKRGAPVIEEVEPWLIHI